MCLEEQVSKWEGILEAGAGTSIPSRLSLGQALRISLSRVAGGRRGPTSYRGYLPLPRMGGACWRLCLVAGL